MIEGDILVRTWTDRATTVRTNVLGLPSRRAALFEKGDEADARKTIEDALVDIVEPLVCEAVSLEELTGGSRRPCNRNWTAHGLLAGGVTAQGQVKLWGGEP